MPLRRRSRGCPIARSGQSRDETSGGTAPPGRGTLESVLILIPPLAAEPDIACVYRHRMKSRVLPRCPIRASGTQDRTAASKRPTLPAPDSLSRSWVAVPSAWVTVRKSEQPPRERLQTTTRNARASILRAGSCVLRTMRYESESDGTETVKPISIDKIAGRPLQCGATELPCRR